MLTQLLLSSAIIAMILSSMLAGIYFIFSNTIMPSLKKTTEGIETMQHINQVIQNPLFFIVFFGSAVSSVAVLVTSTMTSNENFQPTLFLASICLILTFLSTIMINVPLNNMLGTVKQGDSHARAWAYYQRKWVRWNHLRTLLCTLSSVLYAGEILKLVLLLSH